jgi:hypothetical protein
MMAYKKLILLFSYFSIYLLTAEYCFGFNDPMKPASYQNNNKNNDNSEQEIGIDIKKLTVNQIMLKENNQYAVINGKTLKNGDSIGKAVVTNITANSVELNIDDETITIKVTPKNIKSRHNVNMGQVQ